MQALVGDQLSPQGSYPVALAGRCRTGFPAVVVDPIRQAVADGVNRGLKTLKIPPGSQADHTAAIRAPIPFSARRARYSRQNRPPQNRAPRSGHRHRGTAPVSAIGNPGPLEKLLDSQLNKDYQRSRFGGILSLCCLRGKGVATTLAPSFPGNKKARLMRTSYSQII